MLILSTPLPSGGRQEKFFMPSILILKLIAFLAIRPTTETDTVSYTVINGFSSENWVHEFRTPVYPFLLELCERLSPLNYSYIITLFQFLASCGAVLLLYRLLFKLGVAPLLAKATVVFYTLSVSTSVWDGIVLTESLSLSMTVVYCWLLYSYLVKPKLYHMGLCAPLLLVMTFLRPTFVAFIPVTIILLLIHYVVYRPHIRTSLLSLTFLTAAMGLVVLYAVAFYRKYGNFSLSNTLVAQQLAMLVRSGLYQNSANTEIVATLDTLVSKALADNSFYFTNSLPELSIAHQIRALYGNAEVSRFVGGVISGNLPAFLIDRCMVILREMSTPFGRFPELNTSFWSWPGILLYGFSYLMMSVISMGFGLQVALACIAAFIYKLIKNHQMNLVLLSIGGFVTMIYASAFFGTCGDYARTALAAVPFIFIGTAMLLNGVYKWILVAVKLKKVTT